MQKEYVKFKIGENDYIKIPLKDAKDSGIPLFIDGDKQQGDPA